MFVFGSCKPSIAAQYQVHGISTQQAPAANRRAITSFCELSDSQLRVKLMLAKNSGKLDLSESSLETIPDGLTELTGLEELSLAGNSIRELPDIFGQLQCLQKLNIAGNRLGELPDSICALTNLQGLWVHGNVLESVPADLGKLCSLRTMSLAGNALSDVPESLLHLKELTELNLAGNALTSLPESISSMTCLEKLLAHGNSLKQLPCGLGQLPSLHTLHVMGNELKCLPEDLVENSACVEINAADNQLQELPGDWSGMTRLQSLLLYGNRISDISCSIADLPALSSLWLEGNPLQNTAELLTAVASSPSLRNLGITSEQLSTAGCDTELLSLKLSSGCQSGPGYFKLVPGRPCIAVDQNGTDQNTGGSKCVVVAFGSAPGEPNWAALLSRIASAPESPQDRSFDVLYVVDTRRSWYGGGNKEEFQRWHSEIQQAVQGYESVVMLGDSMGATGALMFSDLASQVVAFCPQVDLHTASIRPGKDDSWFQQCTETVVQSVSSSSAVIQVHTGTWHHDLKQAQALPEDKVVVQVHPFDSHRLAFALNAAKRLAPIVHDMIALACGYNTGNVRPANIL